MTILGWMIYALAVGALAGSAAWCLDRALAGLGLPTRWVWAGALALSFILPAAALLSSSAGFALEEGHPGNPASAAIEGADPADAAAAPDAAAPSWAAAPPLAGLGGGVADALDEALAAAASALPAGPGIERWAVRIWAGGSAALGALLLLSALRLGRSTRRLPRAVLRGRAVRIAPRFGPAVVGALRPEIVVPAWAARLPDPELELVLAHEAEHLRARDPLLLAGALLPLVLAPWNAPLWWQLRQLRGAIELDCDRRVLRAGAPPRRYAALLLQVGTHRSGPLLGAPALAGPKSLLERRLSAMKTPSLSRTLPLSLLAAVVAAGLLVLACEADTPTGTPESAEQAAAAEDASAESSPAESDPAGIEVLDEQLAEIEAALERVRELASRTPEGRERLEHLLRRMAEGPEAPSLDQPDRLPDGAQVQEAPIEVAAGAEHGVATGRVIDARTGEGIAGVQVQLQGTGRGAITTHEGRFIIVRASPGVFRLTATHDVHGRTHADNVRIQAGEVVTMELELEG